MLEHNSGTKLKVGIVTSRFADVRNIEHVLYRVSENLSGVADITMIGGERYSDRLLEMNRNYTDYKPPGWLAALPDKLRYFIVKFLQVLFFARSERPDLLLTLSGIGANGIIVSLAGRLTGTRGVVRVTSDIFHVYRSKASLKEKALLFVKNNIIGRVSIKLADRVVVLHKALVDELVAQGYKKSKFFVVSQPLQFPEEVSFSSTALMKELGISESDYVVSFIGRMDPDKNLEFFSSAVKELSKKVENIVFLVVGSGSRKDWLEYQLKGYKCVFVSQVSRDKLKAYYDVTDVLVQTSVSEGLSSVIGEALYLGVPVVSTDSGCITRALVSNICKNEAEMIEMVTEQTYVRDPFPEYLDPEFVKGRWISLVKEVNAL